MHVWRVWAGGAGGRAAAHTHTGVTHAPSTCTLHTGAQGRIYFTQVTAAHRAAQ